MDDNKAIVCKKISKILVRVEWVILDGRCIPMHGYNDREGSIAPRDIHKAQNVQSITRVVNGITGKVLTLQELLHDFDFAASISPLAQIGNRVLLIGGERWRR